MQRPSTDWLNWLRGTLLSTRNASGGNDFGTTRPTYVRFHPTAPNVLYVGLENGQVIVYRLNANGQILQERRLVPALGNPGAVGALDVGEVIQGSIRLSVLAFGGPNGLSVWAAIACNPDFAGELNFYDQDVAFFPDAGFIQVSQPTPGGAL